MKKITISTFLLVLSLVILCMPVYAAQPSNNIRPHVNSNLNLDNIGGGSFVFIDKDSNGNISSNRIHVIDSGLLPNQIDNLTENDVEQIALTYANQQDDNSCEHDWIKQNIQYEYLKFNHPNTWEPIEGNCWVITLKCNNCNDTMAAYIQ